MIFPLKPPSIVRIFRCLDSEFRANKKLRHCGPAAVGRIVIVPGSEHDAAVGPQGCHDLPIF